MLKNFTLKLLLVLILGSTLTGCMFFYMDPTLETTYEDEWESDDDIEYANSIEVGDTQLHTIHDYMDNDHIKFYGYANTTYLIETTIPVGEKTVLQLALTDIEMWQFVAWDDQTPGIIEYRTPLESDGEYCIKVSGYRAGEYSISVTEVDNIP